MLLPENRSALGKTCIFVPTATPPRAFESIERRAGYPRMRLCRPHEKETSRHRIVFCYHCPSDSKYHFRVDRQSPSHAFSAGVFSTCHSKNRGIFDDELRDELG